MNYDKIITYFNFEPVSIDINLFLLNSAICIVLALFLELTYRHCANSLSNRSMFAYNFIIVSLTTMLIITLVGSSVALSLGLVGALSIVRYRAAIKEPEELSYLFLAIASGLGLGANQPIVTVISFGILVSIIWIRYFIKPTNKIKVYNFSVRVQNPSSSDLNTLNSIIQDNFKVNSLKRFETDENILDVGYMVKVKNIEDLSNCSTQIKAKLDSVLISFIDFKN